MDTKKDNRPARRSALLAAELNRYAIDIVTLSETRLADSGQVEEVGQGFTFFWKGKAEADPREAGVFFFIYTFICLRRTLYKMAHIFMKQRILAQTDILNVTHIHLTQQNGFVRHYH